MWKDVQWTRKKKVCPVTMWCPVRLEVLARVQFSLALIAGTSPQKSISARREQVPFSMAMGNGELMHECFPNNGAWEQQDRNQTMKQRKKVRKGK